MTNEQFFSRIYGGKTVDILQNHDMRMVSASEKEVEVAYTSHGERKYVTLECDDAPTLIDALEKYVKDFNENGKLDRELFETVAAEIREEWEKEPWRFVTVPFDEKVYNKLVQMGNDKLVKMGGEEMNQFIGREYDDARAGVALTLIVDNVLTQQNKALVTGWLKAQISELTYETFTVTASSGLDRSLKLNEETAQKLMDEFEARLDDENDEIDMTFPEYLTDFLRPTVEQSRDAAVPEKELMDKITARVVDEYPELREAWTDFTVGKSVREILEAGGYKGVTFEYADYLDVPYATRYNIEHFDRYRAEKLLKPFIHETLMDITYGKDEIRITPSSYDDVISPSTIMDAYDEFREDDNGYVTFEDFLTGKLDEVLFWDRADKEREVIEEIGERIEDTDDETLTEAWETLTDYCAPYEILELGGLANGIYHDINAYLDNDTYNINLMFAGKNERNFDMGAIHDLFTSDPPYENAKYFEELQDNALSYLIRQQGHTTDEIFAGLNGYVLDDKFSKSVINELDNFSNIMGEVTLLISCKGSDFVALLDSIAKGEGYIEFSQKTTAGLFNEWNGGGSLLEIVLEKPAVFPASMVRNIQIEGAKRTGEYTVNDVYGLIGSCWTDGSFKLTDTAPELQKEDLETTRKALHDLVDISEKDEDTYDLAGTVLKDDVER